MRLSVFGTLFPSIEWIKRRWQSRMKPDIWYHILYLPCTYSYLKFNLSKSYINGQKNICRNKYEIKIKMWWALGEVQCCRDEPLSHLFRLHLLEFGGTSRSPSMEWHMHLEEFESRYCASNCSRTAHVWRGPLMLHEERNMIALQLVIHIFLNLACFSPNFKHKMSEEWFFQKKEKQSTFFIKGALLLYQRMFLHSYRNCKKRHLVTSF